MSNGMFPLFRMDSHADLIHKSIMKLLTMDKIHTPDLGGSAKTSEFIEALKGDILSKIVKYH